jgi:hypothetical protein
MSLQLKHWGNVLREKKITRCRVTKLDEGNVDTFNHVEPYGFEY